MQESHGKGVAIHPGLESCVVARNVSPKGHDTFRVIGSDRIAYLDYVGSGVETVAHVRENGRIVVMWCSFEGTPRIVRLHGRGEVLDPALPEFDRLRRLFPEEPSGRAIISVAVHRVSDSCGFGVPLFQFVGDRSQLAQWAARKGPDGLHRYQGDRNTRSIDGLPAITWVQPPSTRPEP